MTKVKCNALLATKCSLLEWKVSTKYQFKCKFSLSTRKLSTALSQEVEFDGLKTLDYSWARFFADWCMRKTLAARHHQPTRWNCGTSNRPTSHRSINKQYRPLSLRPDGVCMNMNSISVLTTSKRRNVMWTKENYKTVFLPLLLSFTIASRFILFYFLERREWQVHLHARKMRNKNRRNYYNHKCAPRGQVPSLFAMRTSRTSFICLFCYVLVIFFSSAFYWFWFTEKRNLWPHATTDNNCWAHNTSPVFRPIGLTGRSGESTLMRNEANAGQPPRQHVAMSCTM